MFPLRFQEDWKLFLSIGVFQKTDSWSFWKQRSGVLLSLNLSIHSQCCMLYNAIDSTCHATFCCKFSDGREIVVLVRRGRQNALLKYQYKTWPYWSSSNYCLHWEHCKKKKRKNCTAHYVFMAKNFFWHWLLVCRYFYRMTCHAFRKCTSPLKSLYQRKIAIQTLNRWM